MLEQLKRDIKQIIVDEDGGRSLALLFVVISFILVLYWYITSWDVRLYALLFLFFLGLIGIIKPYWFRIPYRWWMIVAVVVGFFVFRTFLLLVYVVAVVPTSLILRLLGKDLLSVRWDRKADTYWRDRSSRADIKQMEEPF